MKTTATQEQFYHEDQEAEGCWCSIHRSQDGEPFTVPLGFSFASRVEARPITREQAASIYEAHHSYMSNIPKVNIQHHGIVFQGQLMGAITYRHPLMRHKRVHLDAEGKPIPEPRQRSRIRNTLPDRLHRTALAVLRLDRSSEADVHESLVIDGDRFIEAARICLGVRMPNLASAGLARSQERFVEHAGADTDMRYLLTFIRSDYDATMIRALRDKGWTCVGWTRPSQAGNREEKTIRDHRKWVFLCPVETVHEQTTMGEW